MSEEGERARGSGRGLDLVFHAEAFAFDHDGFGVMEDAVEDGAGDAGVVIEDLGPVFVSLVGGDDERTAFVALADDLEEQVGTGLVEREVASSSRTRTAGVR